MVTNMYSVRDKKARVYHRPFYSLTDGQATRELQLAMGQDKSLASYPEDFALWWVGRWNDETGEVLSSKAAEHRIVCELSSLVRSDEDAVASE